MLLCFIHWFVRMISLWTLKFSSRFGKSIFIVIYFTRYTSCEMERSDRLSRSTKYVLHRSEVHRLFHIRISEIDILDSSICAQKQLRMRMKLCRGVESLLLAWIFICPLLTDAVALLAAWTSEGEEFPDHNSKSHLLCWKNNYPTNLPDIFEKKKKILV